MSNSNSKSNANLNEAIEALIFNVNEVIENNVLFGDEMSDDFKLVSWPFSRKIVTAICAKEGIELKREPICKRFEQFHIEGAKFNNVMEQITKLVTKEAKQMEGSMYTNRNIVTDMMLEGMYGEVPKVRLKAENGAGKIKKVKKVEDEVVEDEVVEDEVVEEEVVEDDFPEVEGEAYEETLVGLSEEVILKMPKERVSSHLMGTELEQLGVKELRAACKHFNVKGAWKATKASLIDSLIDIRETASL